MAGRIGSTDAAERGRLAEAAADRFQDGSYYDCWWEEATKKGYIHCVCNAKSGVYRNTAGFFVFSNVDRHRESCDIVKHLLEQTSSEEGLELSRGLHIEVKQYAEI